MLHQVRPELGEEAQYLRTGITPMKLIRFLERRLDWTKLDPDELSTGPRQRRSTPSLVLTFDDGYRDVLIHVLPVLERFEAPALVFITTGFIDRDIAPFEQELAFRVATNDSIRLPTGELLEMTSQKMRLNTYHQIRLDLKGRRHTVRRQRLDDLSTINGWTPYVPSSDEYLNWDEIRVLADHELITVGGHSRTHSLLTDVQLREARDEIVASKKRLESMLARKTEFFSYPYGGHSRKTRRLVRRAGYEYAFATQLRRVDILARRSRFAIPRVDITHVS